MFNIVAFDLTNMREVGGIMRLLNFASAAVALIVSVFCSSAFAQNVQSVDRQTVSACAWSHMSDEDREAILNAYHQASVAGIDTHMDEVTQALVVHNDAVNRAFAVCDNNPNTPKALEHMAIETQALQAGATAEIEAAKFAMQPSISRGGLEMAWLEAPAAVQQCARADAEKTFGLNDLTCPDMKTVLWFVHRFNLNPYLKSDKPVAKQVLIFYHSKAQGEYADAIFARAEKDAVAKPES